MRHCALLAFWLMLIACALRTVPALGGELRVPIGPFSGGEAMTIQVKSITELRDEGVVRQQLDFSCGAATVATIFTYYLNMPCTERDIINYTIAHTDARELLLRKGFTLLDLKNYAQSKGVQAIGYRLTFEQLRGQNKPILVPLLIKAQNIRHYVVFLGCKDDQVFLADPAAGRRALPRQAFEQQWDTKIGMIFSTPNLPLLQQTGLAIRLVDETTLPSSTVLAIALQTTLLYFHATNEF